MVVALIALFVALSGTGYAAVTVTGKTVKNGSLSGADVKNSSLTGTDIKNSSLTTSDVKDRSLLSKDFKAGQVPAGARGATGPAGPLGPRGAAGASDVVVRTGTANVPANTSGGASAFADCQPGERAVGGGGELSTASTGEGLVKSRPDPPTSGETPTGWFVNYSITSTPSARTLTAYVVCAQP
jgi:hypothetical protein